MKLQWEHMGEAHGKAIFADTPREPIIYGYGRWLIRKTLGRNRHYLLKFNGQLIARHETVKAAKDDAEKRTGSEPSG